MVRSAFCAQHVFGVSCSDCLHAVACLRPHPFVSELSRLHAQKLSGCFCRCNGNGGPNAFEQHMALQLAKVRLPSDCLTHGTRAAGVLH